MAVPIISTVGFRIFKTVSYLARSCTIEGWDWGRDAGSNSPTLELVGLYIQPVV